MISTLLSVNQGVVEVYFSAQCSLPSSPLIAAFGDGQYRREQQK